MTELKNESKNDILWTSGKTIALIEFYKNRECLWNVNIKDYKNKTKRLEAISSMCDALEVSRNQLVKKIHNLRNQFNSESKKIQRRSNSNIPYTCKWEFYDNLKFLKNVIIRRPGYGSLQSFDDQKSYCSYDTSQDSDTDPLNTTVTKTRRKHDYSQNEIEVIPAEVLDEHVEDYIKKNNSQSITNTTIESITFENDMHSYNDEKPSKKLKLNKDDSKDEYQTFGDFVATEIRSVHNINLRRKLKRKIMQAILDIGNEDEVVNINIKLT